MPEFKLESPSFQYGEMIPKDYSREGADLSPALAWSGVPKSTVELALICEDPDAPQPEAWVHWVLYKIPNTIHNIPAGLPASGHLDFPKGAFQGTNSYGEIGYGGPLPPQGSGVHRYYFILYALDAVINLPACATKQELEEAIRDHVLAEAELMGKYQVGEKIRKAG